jgi:predicted membrane protein
MRYRNIYRGDYKQYQEQRHRSRVFIGIIIAIVGLVLMLTTMHVLPCIDLEFSWPILLIIIGLLIGIKNSFRNNAWWILIVIGIANFTPQFMIMGRPSRDFAWPAILIIIGIAIALRPKRHTFNTPPSMTATINPESNLNIDVTFGGKKEVVTSKDFKGGTVAVTFAGCEINLAQADITEPSVVLDCRVSFGGVELIVPSHWEVQNEISPSFGSVEDERTIQTGTGYETRKVLILRGSCSFGSIEIKSY